MHRALLFIALFLVAAGAAGCDTGYKFATPNTASGSGSGTSLPGGAATTSTTTPAQPCDAADLTASGGRRQDPNDAGGAVGNVVIANPTSRACELSGIPVVELLTTSGSPLKVQVSTPITPAMAPVKLQPRKKTSAELVFTWDNWCTKSPGALELEIRLAGGHGSLTAPLNSRLGQYVPTCDRPGTASILRVQYAYVDAGPSSPSDA
jgi:Domain of unknown function (DUF4232)